MRRDISRCRISPIFQLSLDSTLAVPTITAQRLLMLPLINFKLVASPPDSWFYVQDWLTWLVVASPAGSCASSAFHLSLLFSVGMIWSQRCFSAWNSHMWATSGSPIVLNKLSALSDGIIDLSSFLCYLACARVLVDSRSDGTIGLCLTQRLIFATKPAATLPAIIVLYDILLVSKQFPLTMLGFCPQPNLRLFQTIWFMVASNRSRVDVTNDSIISFLTPSVVRDALNNGSVRRSD